MEKEEEEGEKEEEEGEKEEEGEERKGCKRKRKQRLEKERSVEREVVFSMMVFVINCFDPEVEKIQKQPHRCRSLRGGYIYGKFEREATRRNAHLFFRFHFFSERKK